MMKLALETPILGGENKIPVTASASVIAPVRDCGIVAQNCVKRDLSLVVIAEILRPRINFFLAGCVPRHLAAERIRLLLPPIGTYAHLCFKILRLPLHAFTLQVSQNLQKDVTFH